MASLLEIGYGSLLPKFGRHFSEAVNDGEVSLEILLQAKGEAGLMLAALGNFVPDLMNA